MMIVLAFLNYADLVYLLRSTRPIDVNANVHPLSTARNTAARSSQEPLSISYDGSAPSKLGLDTALFVITVRMHTRTDTIASYLALASRSNLYIQRSTLVHYTNRVNEER